MTDHDAHDHSLTLRDMEDLAWPQKGVGVDVFEPMLLRNIEFERLQTIQGSSIYHGHVR
jgi:hypothetical protein